MITSRCASAFGAVMPLDRPSELVAEPRTTASTRSWSRTASANRLSTTTPQPSPRTNPSALASKLLHRPVGDSADHLDSAMAVNGDKVSCTPPANATSVSRRRRL
ncbi:Uncharacterised protein [Mycobacterium tuberculosis]|uniref:Uncharacterized protein n=1 Tax=Mycobacterium tuberculosis TaxID=1773 RepID=A0A0T9CQ95_MYCTX|nr:hypothetical protein FF22_01894 [Mycobacterium tuberculosis]CEZ57124.1 Uncharacterised protein [Mycobacterium tuberculosis]CFA16391.1 Uncharacterised protein [Mycobacterium tuberculosis]CFA27016.1 Uncharacterised protein [Mycobacterium tuberculosis]CFA86127.1 Uncharacterised protein [Mycobacterium tuberculosis]